MNTKNQNFIIADNFSGKYFVTYENRLTADASTATIFNSEEEAQKYINESNFNDWAYVTTLE